ncbi:MAG TPA: TetR/AcrR family transcriptional regulator [Bacillaceae bacterium]
MSRKTDPRVKRTRKMFENALLELMEEKDYQKITVQELTKRAALNRATFYLHFYDKNELLEQCLDEALEDLKKSVKIPDFEFNYHHDQPHPAFIRLFEKIMENRDFYKIMLAEAKIPYFTEEVAKVIEQFVEQGLSFLEKDKIQLLIPSNIVKSYITSAYLGVIIWWLKSDMPYTPQYMAKQLTIMSTVGQFVDNPYLKEAGADKKRVSMNAIF